MEVSEKLIHEGVDLMTKDEEYTATVLKLRDRIRELRDRIRELEVEVSTERRLRKHVEEERRQAYVVRDHAMNSFLARQQQCQKLEQEVQKLKLHTGGIDFSSNLDIGPDLE